MQHYNMFTFYFSLIIVIMHSMLHIVYYMVLLLSTSIACVFIAALSFKYKYLTCHNIFTFQTIMYVLHFVIAVFLTLVFYS